MPSSTPERIAFFYSVYRKLRGTKLTSLTWPEIMLCDHFRIYSLVPCQLPKPQTYNETNLKEADPR